MEKMCDVHKSVKINWKKVHGKSLQYKATELDGDC